MWRRSHTDQIFGWYGKAGKYSAGQVLEWPHENAIVVFCQIFFCRTARTVLRKTKVPCNKQRDFSQRHFWHFHKPSLVFTDFRLNPFFVWQRSVDGLQSENLLTIVFRSFLFSCIWCTQHDRYCESWKRSNVIIVFGAFDNRTLALFDHL